jgi:hypothetical protein
MGASYVFQSKVFLASSRACCLRSDANGVCAGGRGKNKTPRVDVMTCPFLTIEEITKAVGKPALSMTDQPLSADMGACTYYSDAAKVTPLVSTQVHLKAGPMHYRNYCETNAGSITPGERIAGLGDQACLRNGAALFVRKGDKLIMITVALMGNMREPLQNLAKVAVVRL